MDAADMTLKQRLEWARSQIGEYPISQQAVADGIARIDHLEALLTLYIARVIDAESIDYIEIGAGYGVDLTEAQRAELTQFAERARQEHGL